MLGYTSGSTSSEVVTVCLALGPDGVAAGTPATDREPLCLRWVLPVTGWFHHHLRGHYPSFNAPTGSCAPPPASRWLQLRLISASLCRGGEPLAGRGWFPMLSPQSVH